MPNLANQIIGPALALAASGFKIAVESTLTPWSADPATAAQR
jgi:hypothetical protein